MTRILHRTLIMCGCALVTVSLAANVWFIARAKATPGGVPAGLTSRATPRVQVGDVVNPFTALNLQGNAVTVDYSGDTPTILYVLSPDCAWCQRNIANINSIAKQVAGRYRVIGVSLREDALADHIKTAGYPFAVLSGVDAATRDTYRLGPTPATIVIGKGGQVLRSWLGAFSSSSTKYEIEEFLQVRLPGVSGSIAQPLNE